jgi:putative membrane protein
LAARPLLLIYGITWALESIGLAVFWGLPGPAVAGFLVMGSVVALTIYNLRAA